MNFSSSNKKDQKKKEIYMYDAPWQIYAMSWSNRKDKPFRMAIASFIEDYSNYIQIIQLNEDKNDFEKKYQFEHPYPPTKIQWLPELNSSKPDLLASSGDYLRIWQVGKTVEPKCVLNNNKNSEFCAPLTSFDWNVQDTNIIGTCSIDTTCTIWDIEAQQSKTQLIAHDKEVYDIAFAKGRDVFSSVGADGSVRLFDLRSLEHSTIIYESPDNIPILRVSWNKQDPNYLGLITMDSSKVTIIDIRVPSEPVAELNGHTAPVNSIAWAPHSTCHICSVGDDSQALIWDLQNLPKPVDDPILSYTAESEVNQLQWSTLHTDWISISFDKKMQTLRV